jgi:RNA polymerase sigma factor (sigma-70 family)
METSIGGDNVRFQPTPWTMVLRGDAEALERLLAIYWKPVYFYLRRKGHDIEEAKDLTQEFWATMLDRAALAKADPDRGRFRTFLLAALSNFRTDQARRRMGKPLPVDFATVEPQLVSSGSPDEAFQRGWARSILAEAVEKLEPPYLDAVKLHLAGEKDIPGKLGISDTDARNRVHRGRAKLRELVIARLRESLDDPTQLEAEIADFLRAIR